MLRIRSVRALGAIAGLLCCLAVPAEAQFFAANNLVTDDQSANAAQITDPGLKNAWGVSFGATSPFWVSSNGAGTSTLYRVDPLTQATTKVSLVVTIPGAGNPTGQVFNSGNASGAFNGDLFLFVSEDGTVSGWRSSLGTAAETLALASSANIYKGSAFATIAGNSYLYGANFHAGSIDVFKGSAAAPSLAGSFVDPTLPSGYAPFNVQRLGDSLYVAYAKQDAAKVEEVTGVGFGFVDRFDLQGNFLERVAGNGTLNAPWGLAIAPSSFGALAGALLVGNFGDGRINAYNATTHAFLGQIKGANDQPLEIDGLWALTPGNDGSAGSSSMIYFSAGPDDEEHGLFGVLVAVPEPSTYALLLAGLAIVGVIARRRR
ncbi:MAG: TIGR03118 family protein [Betaproteobacteria bacterium]|nr:MAG: TIGR03118 family protein [Betaproteobacteria bacterium]